jgi:formylglycine-generating enzyme required for sulfatase activity
MKHKFLITVIAALASVLLVTCDMDAQDVKDIIGNASDTKDATVADNNVFGFTAAQDLREGDADAGMTAGKFSGGLTVMMETGEHAGPANGKFMVSEDGTELIIMQELSGGPHHITFRVSPVPTSDKHADDSKDTNGDTSTQDGAPAETPASDEGTWFIHEAIIFVAFKSGPTALNFESDYRLMTETAVACGLVPVGTFEPQGGLSPYSFSLVPGTEENSEHNALFRGGDGIYAKSALEAGEYRIRVRCTANNGMFFDEDIVLTVEEYAPPTFLDKDDYAYFPETTVDGSIDYYYGAYNGTYYILVDGRNLTVPAFALAKYETTQALWWEVYSWAIASERNGNVYTFLTQTGLALPTNGPANGNESKPQIKVYWLNVVLWLNAFSEKEGLTPVYYTDESFTNIARSADTTTVTENGKPTKYKTPIYTNWDANGYRLPCEVEWELAARGGVPSLDADSPWMYQYAGTNDPFEFAKNYGWSIKSIVKETGKVPAATDTFAVGLKLPNTAGLYDMTGNASEWAGDIYTLSYTSTGIDADTPVRGPEDVFGQYRFWRGSNVAGALLIENRGGNTSLAHSAGPGTNGNYPGFRIARTLAN